jgi:predicted extracellular nuclease
MVSGLLILILVATSIPWATLPASAQTSDLFFSEYIEGSSNNKALEIYNGTGAAVDLAAGGYNVQMYFNGNTSASLTINLTGTVADGDVFVLAQSSAVTAILEQADQTSGAGFFNGDDAVVLRKGTTILDAIGQVGVDPGTEWGSGDTSTADNTLRRKADVCAGDTDAADAFDPSLGWDGFPIDTFNGLGAHTANCGGPGPEPGQALPLFQGFDDCTLAGWQIVSVDADTSHTWSCSETYSNIDVNGYGDSAPANEWLITPPLDLDAQDYDTLTFRSYTNYTDINYPQLHVLYSTDYDGGGDPTTATWTELSGITFSPEGSGTWTDSGNVDLSGISGTNVYLAFQYVSSGTGGGTAANWRLDAINVFEGTPPSHPLPLVEDFDDCTLADWQIVSVDADTSHTWSCSETYSNIDVNGYGDSAPANEWLITPPLDLDAQGNDTLTFRNYTNYTDVDYPQLHVLYSTDYDGGGDPTTATWTELSGITFSPEGSGTWTDSGNVDLSGIGGTHVYIAFQYVSSGTGGGTAANWRLDAINVFEGEPAGGLVINEIMQNPAAVYDSNGEWFELYNPTGGDIDINGWTIKDEGSDSHLIDNGGPLFIPAGGYLVLGNNADQATNGGVTVDYAYPSGWYLGNSDDEVVLLDSALNEIDRVEYDGGTNFPDPTGASMSLIDPDLDNNVGANWCTSATPFGDGDLGTPGWENACEAPEQCGDPFTPIYTVQGDGLVSPLAGTQVSVEGIVVGDFQNNASEDDGDLNGFHIQDPDGDGITATSDGVFIYAPGAADVAMGDRVRVRGAVSEYNGLTEITVSQLWICSTGNNLPAAAELWLPVAAVDDLEAYEGMWVTFPQALVISEYYNFDRYGEIVLSSERLDQPTAVEEPGPDAIELIAENLLDRITLDDGLTTENPDWVRHPNGAEFTLSNRFRGGDTLTNAAGVIDYTRGLYRIQPTQGADYAFANPRTEYPADVGGGLKVVSFNVLNYFTTIDTGDWICGPSGNMECRGADTEEEFERQRNKIISAMARIDADVVGLIEIENHPGDVPVADLVSGLNVVMGAGTYDYIATGAIGTDAIRQAFIYKPATVTPQGAYAILDSSVDARFLDDYNRPVLAQTFMGNTTGGIFTVAVNHLKSKGSDCNAIGDPDAGDGSGNCNLTRKLAAEALVDWLATDPTGSGDGDNLIIGDLNSYDKEDPIDAIKAGADDILGTEDDYTDLILAYQGEHAYSYVFDGQIGYLDHALANGDLSQETSGVTVWHINADEPDLIDYDMSYKSDAQDALYEPDPYRSSDHDPVIAGLNVCDEIAPSLEVTVTPDTLWPANHKYVDVVATVFVADNFDPNPVVTLISVTSNEADDGLGDGDTPDDIVIVDDFHFQLRAERAGAGQDRVYTITYQATDVCGNTTVVTATVTVPHDQGED